MCEGKNVAFQPVVTHEEPPDQAGVHREAAVGESRVLMPSGLAVGILCYTECFGAMIGTASCVPDN
jgi:hypothetical protein